VKALASRVRSASFIVALALVEGCGSEHDAAVPRALNLVLTTPNTDDGGVVVTVAGGPVDSARGLSGYRAQGLPGDDHVYRIVVTGALHSGPVAQIWIPDRDRAGDYSAQVGQAAAAGSYAQRDVAGYAMTVTK
jgi:hypothetical protein